MDDKIKSAYERAMERADALDAPTDEERLEWKWIPEGKKLAAIAMSGTTDVALEMSKVEEAGRNYVLKGLFDVLVENLRLPKSEQLAKNNERVLEVLTQLKPEVMGELAERIRYVCNQFLQFYPQQQQEAHNQLKEHIQNQLEQMMQQQTGTPGPFQLGNIEARPEFQSQWLRVMGQIEEPYEEHLREFRNQIRLL
mgnify:CR=1 FL=1